MHDLVWTQNVRRGYAGACRADIEGFCKLNELGPGSVRRAQENGHLQTNARGSSGVRGIHALAVLQETSLHNRLVSTQDLVREGAD